MRHTRILELLVAFQFAINLFAYPSAHDRAAREITVIALPGRPLVEISAGQQSINFDLLVTNSGKTLYRLVGIRLKVFDRTGSLELERELNENGKPPALDMVGDRLLQPGGVLDIYQPFFSFPANIDPARMRFELLFMEDKHSSPPIVFDPDATVTIEVHPQSYTPAAYCLPLHGLILVHDGHDFYSHHRRYSLAKRFATDRSSAVSANLYANDFVAVAADGALFRGDRNQKESWLTYGAPIFAPAAGTVIEAISDVSENTFAANGDAQIPPSAEAKDPAGFGNHVTIRHSDGRVSWLLHMQPGSVRVKPGDRVAAGQLLGKVGFSGDSLFPHLHYTVTDSSAYPSQGVPVYFSNFVKVLGRRKLPIAFGPADTGDLIQQADLPCRLSPSQTGSKSVRADLSGWPGQDPFAGETQVSKARPGHPLRVWLQP